MKKLFVLALLLLNFSLVFGQGDKSVVDSSPPVTQKTINSLIRFIEWHFEIALSADQRAKYESLLVADLRKGKLNYDIKTIADSMEKIRLQGTWLTIANYHKENVGKDESDAWSQSLRGEKDRSYGKGIRAQFYREAKNGIASAAYFVQILDAYEKPVIDLQSNRSLVNSDVDALYEWSAYRMEKVSGKKIERSAAAREQMKERLVTTWKTTKGSDAETNLFFWIRDIRNEWLIWRAADYYLFERMTPFQQKEKLVEWGQELMKISPQVKPFLVQKINEYKTYVAKMPPAELKAEFDLKRQRDEQFAFEIQKLQVERQSNQASYNVMRESLLKSHVTNLNISENTGNTGYVWVIKP